VSDRMTAPQPGATRRPSRSASRFSGAVRSVPPEAILVGFALFATLTFLAAADPVMKITDSIAPFTDEAGNWVNARNFAQLGTWSTDQWNLYLVNLPFSLLEAAVFKIFGVGLVQARMAMIASVSLTAFALVWGLRGITGRVTATFAGLAFGFSGLILFYGKLAFLEDLVVLGLTLGTLVLARQGRLTFRSGLLTGVFYAVAIGTKPSALFAIAGILLALALVWGWRDPNMRRWLAGCGAVIAAAGLAWVLIVWLPNRNAVATDIQIWPPYTWNVTPVALFDSVKAYLTGKSDHIFGPLLLPLIGLGVAGLLSIVAFRKRLSEVQARVAVAAFAWALFGFGVLMIVSYRPNRYVVPLVPSLAILAAIGLHLFGCWLRERLSARTVAAPAGELPAAGAGPAVGELPATGALPAGGAAAAAEEPEAAEQPEAAERPASRGSRAQGRARWAPSLLAAVAIVVSIGPGLVLYGGWARNATHVMVTFQDRYSNTVPAGQTVTGSADVALFFMRTKADTVLHGLANGGDLYAQGVRWYLQTIGSGAPEGVPADVWATRDRVFCTTEWRGYETCLFHLK
jgi:hypothetical protein